MKVLNRNLAGISLISLTSLTWAACASTSGVVHENDKDWGRELSTSDVPDDRKSTWEAFLHAANERGHYKIDYDDHLSLLADEINNYSAREKKFPEPPWVVEQAQRLGIHDVELTYKTSKMSFHTWFLNDNVLEPAVHALEGIHANFGGVATLIDGIGNSRLFTIVGVRRMVNLGPVPRQLTVGKFQLGGVFTEKVDKAILYGCGVGTNGGMEIPVDAKGSFSADVILGPGCDRHVLELAAVTENSREKTAAVIILDHKDRVRDAKANEQNNDPVVKSEKDKITFIAPGAGAQPMEVSEGKAIELAVKALRDLNKAPAMELVPAVNTPLNDVAESISGDQKIEEIKLLEAAQKGLNLPSPDLGKYAIAIVQGRDFDDALSQLWQRWSVRTKVTNSAFTKYSAGMYKGSTGYVIVVLMM